MAEHKNDPKSNLHHGQNTGKAAPGQQNKQSSENDPDTLAKEADKNRTREPGSQSNSSGRHNNGRGGGK